MMQGMNSFLRAFRLTTLAGLFMAGSAFAGELVAHNAFYSLEPVATGGAVEVDARGAMQMELGRVCDGWTLVQRLTMKTDAGNGRTGTEDIRFAGWESFDGLSYRFNSRRTSDGERTDTRGHASLVDRNSGGEATFTQPGARAMALAPDTVFPVSHTRLLIERAEAGRRQVFGPVFDGTDGQGPQAVSVFIGPKREAGTHGIALDDPLVERPGWTIRLAFFPREGDTSAPEYEIELVQLDNGVVPRMVLDYGQFAVVLRLERIEAVPAAPC